jgi:hypothetical protein
VRAIGWVLVAACLETLFVVFVGHVSSQAFSRALLAGMAGMRNAPEENLMLAALSNILMGALVLLVVVITLLNVRRFKGKTQPFPDVSKDGFPLWTVLCSVVVWIGIAIPEQVKQYHFVTHAGLIGEGKYRESLDYMGGYSKSDFPASRRIEPNPYEYRVWEQLPKVMANLRPTDPEWIRRVYLSHMEAMFSHHWLNCDSVALVAMFGGLERLPEGKEWIERNRSVISKINQNIERRSDDSPEKQKADKELEEIMLRLGVDLNTKRVRMV